MNRRWLAIIVVSVALLIASTVLLLLARPALAPALPSSSSVPSAVPAGAASVPPALPSSSPVPSAASTSAGAEVGIAFSDVAAPEDAAWYRIGADPRRSAQTIQVGTMRDGITFEAELPFDPTPPRDAIVPLRPVVGVAAGVVVTVTDDGRHSTMHAVVAATGAVHDILSSDDMILDAILDRTRRRVYFVTADRLTGDLTGGWQVPIGAAQEPEPIEALVGARTGIHLVAVTRFWTRLLLSDDGSTLALFRCVVLECALRAVRADDGALVGGAAVPRGGGFPFAITNEWALLLPIVPDGPHRIGEVVDLATGETRPMPFDGWPFGFETVAVQGPDGPTLVCQSAGFNRPPQLIGQPEWQPEVTLIGLPGFESQGTIKPPLGSLGILRRDDYSVGADLPAGWILIQGSQPGMPDVGAYALDLADGELVPLPAMGEFVVQG